MELNTVKISTLVIDVKIARTLFKNLGDFFVVWDKNPEEFDGDLYLLAEGEIDGKQPVALEIYVDPTNLGEVEFRAETTD